MDLKTRINNAISYTQVILDSDSKGHLSDAYLKKVIRLLTDIRMQHYPEQAKLDKEATPADAELIFNKKETSS